MIDIPNSALSRLIEAYAIANTPEFLVRRFAGDESTKTIADHHTTQDIVGSLNELLQADEKPIPLIVSAYALLIALTFKDYSETREGIQTIELGTLEWAADIWRHHLRRHINTKNVLFPGYSHNPTEPGRSDSGTSNVDLTNA
ncbi:MAG: hypothetical protein HYY49_06280 [Ignavibacteriales bacterium]|nr:hypothetical protein [Ignavibacteriales bacterium]